MEGVRHVRLTYQPPASRYQQPTNNTFYLRRRGLDAYEKCLLCDQEEETANHLLVTRPLAREVWWHVCSWARCVCSFTAVSLTEWWEQLVMAQAPRRREGTSTLFMLTCWMILKERNSRHSKFPPFEIPGGSRSMDRCWCP
jgi:hypothetical protein